MSLHVIDYMYVFATHLFVWFFVCMSVFATLSFCQILFSACLSLQFYMFVWFFFCLSVFETPSFCLSLCLHVYLCDSICLSDSLSAIVVFVTLYLFVCLCGFISACLWVIHYVFVCLCDYICTYLFMSFSVCLSVRVSLYLFVCMRYSLSTCLSVWLCIHLLACLVQFHSNPDYWLWTITSFVVFFCKSCSSTTNNTVISACLIFLMLWFPITIPLMFS